MLAEVLEKVRLLSLGAVLVGPAMRETGGPVLLEPKVEEEAPQILEDQMLEVFAQGILVQQAASGDQAQLPKQYFLNKHYNHNSNSSN